MFKKIKLKISFKLYKIKMIIIKKLLLLLFKIIFNKYLKIKFLIKLSIKFIILKLKILNIPKNLNKEKK